MASFRIHEDQENRAPVLRQKQKAMAEQSLRSILGLIDNNITNKHTNQDRKAMKDTKLIKNVTSNNNKKLSKAPVVPVAQFEAFKVYEDEDDEEIIKNDLNTTKTKMNEEPDKENIVDKSDEKDKNDTDPIVDVKSPETLQMSIEKMITPEPHERITARRRPFDKNVFFEVEEYRNDIYVYLREREKKFRPKPGYIVKQQDLNTNMRAILVDWLVEVSEEYRLHTETLYLAVSYIDRFLSYMSVVRAKLQLVGTAAMFLAAKYEEIFPPDVNEFVYITDDTYTKQQIIRMEHLILKVLCFDLSIPTPLAFINAMCVTAKLDEKTMYLAMYLCELSTLEVEDYLLHLPSVLAASAIALARYFLDEEPWNEQLYQATSYKLEQLEKAIIYEHKMSKKAPYSQQTAIREKYKSGKYLHVSNIEPKDDLFISWT